MSKVEAAFKDFATFYLDDEVLARSLFKGGPLLAAIAAGDATWGDVVDSILTMNGTLPALPEELAILKSQIVAHYTATLANKEAPAEQPTAPDDGGLDDIVSELLGDLFAPFFKQVLEEPAAKEPELTAEQTDHLRKANTPVITKYDHYAAAALTGMLAAQDVEGEDEIDVQYIAEMVHKMANTMIETLV